MSDNELITISLKDLETLIFAAGAIKPIEAALDIRKRDPFVPTESIITAALQRLAADARDARRSKEIYATPYDSALTEDELGWLEAICENEDPRKAAFDIIFDDRFEIEAINSLAVKGMIIVGTPVHGVVWPGAERAEVWPVDPTRGYYLKPTMRGMRTYLEVKDVLQGKSE